MQRIEIPFYFEYDKGRDSLIGRCYRKKSKGYDIHHQTGRGEKNYRSALLLLLSEERSYHLCTKFMPL